MDDDCCGICLKSKKEPSNPDACEHKFCLACLTKWSRESKTCPICKARYSTIIICDTGKEVKIHSRRKRREQVLYDFTTFCEVCGNDDDGDPLLLCDACNLGFHCLCLQPPLYDIPEGRWECLTCRRVEKITKLKKAHPQMYTKEEYEKLKKRKYSKRGRKRTYGQSSQSDDVNVVDLSDSSYASVEQASWKTTYSGSSSSTSSSQSQHLSSTGSAQFPSSSVPTTSTSGSYSYGVTQSVLNTYQPIEKTYQTLPNKSESLFALVLQPGGEVKPDMLLRPCEPPVKVKVEIKEEVKFSTQQPLPNNFVCCQWRQRVPFGRADMKFLQIHKDGMIVLNLPEFRKKLFDAEYLLCSRYLSF